MDTAFLRTRIVAIHAVFVQDGCGIVGTKITDTHLPNKKSNRGTRPLAPESCVLVAELVKSFGHLRANRPKVLTTSATKLVPLGARRKLTPSSGQACHDSTSFMLRDAFEKLSTSIPRRCISVM